MESLLKSLILLHMSMSLFTCKLNKVPTNTYLLLIYNSISANKRIEPLLKRMELVLIRIQLGILDMGSGA